LSAHRCCLFCRQRHGTFLSIDAFNPEDCSEALTGCPFSVSGFFYIGVSCCLLINRRCCYREHRLILVA
jgi:hypothetical protein